MDRAQVEDVAVTGVAAGGEGVGRLADGRAVFVRGALPGERVRLTVTEEKSRFARAEILEVLEAAPERVAPPCHRLAAGCGGCDWQHVAPDAQRRLKATIVTDALRRIGRLEPPEPDLGPVLPVEGWRTTVRAVVDGDGRAGFRLRHAHDPLAVGPAGCLVAHPLVDEVLRDGSVPAAGEGGDRPGRGRHRRAAGAVLAEGRRQPGAGRHPGWLGSDELAGGHRAWFHEVVAGAEMAHFRRELLPGPARRRRGPGRHRRRRPRRCRWSPGAAVVDLYSGVGLFAGVLGERTGGRVVAVESNRSAVADARINLADLAGARIVRSDVRRWGPSAADIVVADPSRHGLGADVVPRIGDTGARALALVSCDPGALGRDAGLLAAAGWRLGPVHLVDLFPHTAHVEVVTGWFRGI